MVNTIWFRTAYSGHLDPDWLPTGGWKKTMSAWRSFVLAFVTFHGVCVFFCFCYHDGEDDYCCLDTKPASGMSGHRAGDSNYVTRAAWGHILRDIMVSWSFHWTNILKYYYLGERMTSSLNIVVIHSVEEWGHRWPVNTAEPWVTLFSLFLSLRSVHTFFHFREIWLLWILPEPQIFNLSIIPCLWNLSDLLQGSTAVISENIFFINLFF